MDYHCRLNNGGVALHVFASGFAPAGAVLMTINTFLQIGLFSAILLACVKPLGLFMASVYLGRPTLLDRLIRPLESWFYRIAGIDSKSEMTWLQYASSLLTFSFVSLIAVYGIQRLQCLLPLNPESLDAVSPDSSFNTAISLSLIHI